MAIDQITDRHAHVAIMGLGYVGLPLAVRFAERGVHVLGLDIKPRLVDRLRDGRSSASGITDARVASVVRSDSLVPVLIDVISEGQDAAFQEVAGTEAFIICVETPLTSGRGWEPDTRRITRAADWIVRLTRFEAESGRLPRERLIVLESTTYPGTTRSTMGPLIGLLKELGVKAHLAYSPERINPGPHAFEESGGPVPGAFATTRLVAGVDPESLKTATALYGVAFDSLHEMDSLEAAEMTKLVENTFRFVSIGFANELSRIAHGFGLNVWDIIEAAKTKGYGLELCSPGLIGGHCIPIDPHYMAYVSRGQRQLPSFVDAAERAHQDVKRDAVDLIHRALARRGSSAAGSSILVLGVAYKENVPDVRESGAVDVMRRLWASGARVCYWDPPFSDDELAGPLFLEFTRAEANQLPAHVNKELREVGTVAVAEPEGLRGQWDAVKLRALSGEFACVVIATDHEDFREAYGDLVRSDAALVDLRNAIPKWISGLAEPMQSDMRKWLRNGDRYSLLGVR